MDKGSKIIVFGAGCFWCTEAVFNMVKGVIRVTPGYAGGDVLKPTYASVSTGLTGYAEVVMVKYDTAEISLKELLDIFFMAHNPSTLNQQGNDIGTQYRSIILCNSRDELKEIGDMVKNIENRGIFNSPIITEIGILKAFYEAEECHQNFFLNNPDKAYCYAVIGPKLDKLKKNNLKLIE